MTVASRCEILLGVLVGFFWKFFMDFWDSVKLRDSVVCCRNLYNLLLYPSLDSLKARSTCMSLICCVKSS